MTDKRFIKGYPNYICHRDTPITYQGMKLIPSNSAMREMIKLNVTLADCRKILEEGFDAPRKRKQGVIEKWFGTGKKVYNVVIAKNYNSITEKDVWIVVHVGRFTKR